MNFELNNTIQIADGSRFRLRCKSITKYSSCWILEEFRKSSFLWWSWEGWEIYEFGLCHGLAGTTYHNVELKRKHQTDEEFIWEVEMELDFLGEEYK